MNGGQVIFVDELIGVLDSYFGEEVMVILYQLCDCGYMVIIVIYDLQVVVQVEWVIEICDGEIVCNFFVIEKVNVIGGMEFVVNMVFGWWQFVSGFNEVLMMVWWVLVVNKMCVLLIMLGIIIGIVLVVFIVVVGDVVK